MTSRLVDALTEAEENPSSGFSVNQFGKRVGQETSSNIHQKETKDRVVVEVVDDSSNSSSPSLFSSPVKTPVGGKDVEYVPSLSDFHQRPRLSDHQFISLKGEKLRRSPSPLQAEIGGSVTISCRESPVGQKSRPRVQRSPRGKGRGTQRGQSSPRGRGSSGGRCQSQGGVQNNHQLQYKNLLAGKRLRGNAIGSNLTGLNTNSEPKVKGVYKGRPWQYTDLPSRLPLPTTQCVSSSDNNLSTSSEDDRPVDMDDSDNGVSAPSPVFGRASPSGVRPSKSRSEPSRNSEDSVPNSSKMSPDTSKLSRSFDQTVEHSQNRSKKFTSYAEDKSAKPSTSEPNPQVARSISVIDHAPGLSAASCQSLAALEKRFPGVASKYIKPFNKNGKQLTRKTQRRAAVIKEKVLVNEADSTINIPSDDDSTLKKGSVPKPDAVDREEDGVELISADDRLKDTSKMPLDVTMALCSKCGIWSGSLTICDRCKRDFRKHPPKQFKKRSLSAGEWVCRQCGRGFQGNSLKPETGKSGISICQDCTGGNSDTSNKADSSDTVKPTLSCKQFYVSKLDCFKNGAQINIPVRISAPAKRRSPLSREPNTRKKGRRKLQEPECISLLDSDDESDGAATMDTEQAEPADKIVRRKHKMRTENGQQISPNTDGADKELQHRDPQETSEPVSRKPIANKEPATVKKTEPSPSVVQRTLSGPEWDEKTETLTIDLVLLAFGSKRFVQNPPRASMSPDGVKFHFVSSQHKCAAVQLSSNDIEKVEYCLSRQLCTFFILSTPAFALRTRSAMNMKKGKEHFDPHSKEPYEKLLFFRPHGGSSTSVQTGLMKKLMHKMSVKKSQPEAFRELKHQEVNEYLGKCTPPETLANCPRIAARQVLTRLKATVSTAPVNLVQMTVTGSSNTANQTTAKVSSLAKIVPKAILHGTSTIIILPAVAAATAATSTQPPPKPNMPDPTTKLITYPPPPAVGGITITAEDMECLQEGEFLNDVIIEFYLKYLSEEILTPHDRQRTHIFSSFFYKRLTQREYGNHSGNEIKLSPAEKRHLKVRKWTRRVDLFEKDFIIIPINESSHWYVVIICFPSRVNECGNSSVAEQREPIVEPTDANSGNGSSNDSPPQNGEGSEGKFVPPGPSDAPTPEDEDDCSDGMAPNAEEEDPSCAIDKEDATKISEDNAEYELFHAQKHEVPCIVVMDSLKSVQKRHVVQKLREYLEIEWRTRKQSTCRFTAQNMKGSFPEVPQQSNFSDCGVFILQYVEQFFKKPIRNFTSPLKGLSKWFPDSEVKTKRATITKLILDLKEKQAASSSSNTS